MRDLAVFRVMAAEALTCKQPDREWHTGVSKALTTAEPYERCTAVSLIAFACFGATSAIGTYSFLCIVVYLSDWHRLQSAGHPQNKPKCRPLT